MKEILFNLHALLAVLQQSSFATLITSFFLREKTNKRPSEHPGFSLLNGTETFHPSVPCPFQALQLKSKFGYSIFLKSMRYTTTSKRFICDFQYDLFSIFRDSENHPDPIPLNPKQPNWLMQTMLYHNGHLCLESQWPAQREASVPKAGLWPVNTRGFSCSGCSHPRSCRRWTNWEL